MFDFKADPSAKEQPEEINLCIVRLTTSAFIPDGSQVVVVKKTIRKMQRLSTGWSPFEEELGDSPDLDCEFGDLLLEPDGLYEMKSHYSKDYWGEVEDVEYSFERYHK